MISDNYKQTAHIFDRSMEQFKNYDGSDVGRRAMALKVGICLIRYDLSRHIYELENCPVLGYAKLRLYSDIIKCMIEAKIWIEEKANTELRSICIDSGLGAELHSKLSKKCKKIFRLSEISKYKDFRNTLSGHYDIDIPKSITDLGKINSDSLHNDMKGFVEYLSQWVQNLVEIFNSPIKTL